MISFCFSHCDPRKTHPPAYHLLSIALVGFFQTCDLESFALIFCFDFSSALVTIETMLMEWEKCSDRPNHSESYILCSIVMYAYVYLYM